MSKQGTSRSRVEKTRATSNPIATTISNDIVPGKYNDYDWNLTLERDNSEEYINGIIESILQIAEENIHQKMIKSRIIPFTVDLAKNAMIKIIEWNFLMHDLGEGNRLEEVWVEDNEPESCKIDSWAQGYFPKREASFLYSRHQTDVKECLDDEMSKLEESEEEVEEFSTKLIANIGESEISSTDNKELEDYSENESKYESDGDSKIEIKEKEEIPTVITKSKNKKNTFKPYIGKIKYNDLEMLTETLYETEMRFELERKKKEARQNRSSSSLSATSHEISPVNYEKKVLQKLFQTSLKDYQKLETSDLLMNVNEQLVSLMKVPIEQMMSQRVRANHKLVEVGPLQKPVLIERKKNSNNEKSFQKKSKNDEIKTPIIQSDRHPFPESMLDSIDPVPGVIVQEGDRLKKSVNKKINQSKQIEKEFLRLRPIKGQSVDASYLIKDIINFNHINVKPIRISTPIPSINGSYKG